MNKVQVKATVQARNHVNRLGRAASRSDVTGILEIARYDTINLFLLKIN